MGFNPNPIPATYTGSVDKALGDVLQCADSQPLNSITRKASVLRKMDGDGRATLVSREVDDLTEELSHTLPSSDDTSGTSPAEMVAAGHADSFSLALCHEIGARALAEGEILITSIVSLEEQPIGWTAVSIHLEVLARLPNTTQGAFIDATVQAKLNCLVSRMLRVYITINAKLQK